MMPISARAGTGTPPLHTIGHVPFIHNPLRGQMLIRYPSKQVKSKALSLHYLKRKTASMSKMEDRRQQRRVEYRCQQCRMATLSQGLLGFPKATLPPRP